MLSIFPSKVRGESANAPARKSYFTVLFSASTTPAVICNKTAETITGRFVYGCALLLAGLYFAEICFCAAFGGKGYQDVIIVFFIVPVVIPGGLIIDAHYIGKGDASSFRDKPPGVAGAYNFPGFGINYRYAAGKKTPP